ncbi:MAG TPA: YibE/F family protein, partial [Actinomycetota bacterium]
ENGSDAGRTVGLVDSAFNRRLSPGDRVVLSVSPEAPADLRYDIADYERRAPMLLLGLLFAGVVVALGRWRGALALAGLVVSLAILVGFVLPSILSGHPPVPVALTGSSVVMLLALYLAHGLNIRTTSAVLGTFVSLSLVAILAVGFVQVTRLTGLASEEALFVNVAAARINLEGLLLAGIVIGSLGVLDDVTVTQASAVWELHLANPALGAGELYRSGLRIGRDHIASAVNTLVFAYAGASLPLLILFTISHSHFGDVINGEIVAEEVVRTLVGSVGLVASVPVTTAIAAAAAASDRAPAKAAARAARAAGVPRATAPDRPPQQPAPPSHEPAPATGRLGRRRMEDPEEDEFWRRDDV